MKVWQFVDQKNLVYCDKWEDAASSVKAFVFEKMLELGRDTIKHYNSDLYYDAVWLEKNLDGELNFEWIARESGTHIGDAAETINDDWVGHNSVRYKFNVYHNGHCWVLDTFVIAPKAECTSDDPTNHQGDTCPIHESSDGTFTEDDQGNWHEVTSPVNLIIDEVFGKSEPVGPWMGTQETNFPTLKETPIRKVNKMEDIIRDLREKFREAEATKDQLEAYQSDINDGIDELDTYMSDLDDLISQLDSLPEVSVYVDLDTVSFDS